MFEVWLESLAALLIGLAVYASTNIDNLLVLGAVAAGNPDRCAVTAGFAAATAVVFVISAGFVLLSYGISPGMLGYLGIVPIALGLKSLATKSAEVGMISTTAHTATSIALMLLANSTDTVAVFGPIIGESEGHVVAALLAGFVIAAIVWLKMINRLSGRFTAGGKAQRMANTLAPFVMIAIGVYVLLDSSTDLQ